MSKKVRRLAILGCYPPPYGGVTMHVVRLCSLLAERKVDYVVYNANSSAEDGDRVISVARNRRWWMIWYTLFGKEPSVYIVSPRLASWVCGALMAIFRGKSVGVRLQNSQVVDWERTRGLHFALTSFALRQMDCVVCVNDDLANAVRKAGVAESKVHKFPGFLCPAPYERDPARLDDEVWKFVDAHQPLLSANGRVSWYKGEDLYGLDHIMELVSKLKVDHPRVGAVVCLSDHRPEEQEQVDGLRARARELGVEDDILFNTKPGPFVPVVERSDVFVRPTNTDGDAGSIREAMAFGVPVVASDCVGRPDGVVLFRTRDLADFEEKTRATLLAADRAGTKSRAFTGEAPPWSEPYARLITEFANGSVSG